MRVDSDFAAYVAARGTAVVRSLVLLGSSQAEAEVVARTAFARCHATWGRIGRADDIDTEVYRTVLGVRAAIRRRWEKERAGAAPAAAVPADAGPGPRLDLTEQMRLRHALEQELDRMTAELRGLLVLYFTAGLSQGQVAEVLDLPVETVRSRLPEAMGLIDVVALREASR